MGVKLLKFVGCVHLVGGEWNCQEVLLVSISLSFSMKKAGGNADSRRGKSPAPSLSDSPKTGR